MGRPNSGAYYDEEPVDEHYRRGTPAITGTQRRLAVLEAEAARLDAVLHHDGLIDFDVPIVAAALSQRQAIEHMIGEVARRKSAAEEAARLKREQEEAQLLVLREQIESDPALRAEVKRRNDGDKWEKTWNRSPKRYGVLPGGFPDSLSSKL
jgi:hypothetical protein